jgi:hypothetical protein
LPSSPYSSSSSSTASTTDALYSPWAASKVQKKFPLLQPVLEGLGRYSHLISVDYFNDLMTVLEEVSACADFRFGSFVLLVASDAPDQCYGYQGSLLQMLMMLTFWSMI